MKNDLILFNGKIYSMEKERERFSAMAIRKGKIQELLDFDPPVPKKIAHKSIDLNGRTILPGLIDSHTHFMATAGLSAVGLSCYEVIDGRIWPNSLDGIRERVVALSRKINPSKPLLCSNYIVSAIKEDRLPYRQEIDAWFPERIVIFLTIDGHAGSYSTPALVKMGVDPRGHNGIFAGEVHARNVAKLNALIMGSMDFNTILTGIATTINQALTYGLTGIHCLEGFRNRAKDQSLRIFTMIAPRLPIHLRLYPQIRSVEEASKIFKVMGRRRIGGCGAWAIDGAVGAKTAAFYEAYQGGDSCGQLYNTYENIMKDIQSAHQNGCQVTSHVIGTRGIDQLVKAYDNLEKDKNLLRHRIDHFEFPTPEAVKKAVLQNNLLIVPQPGFFWMDETIKGMGTYRKYLSSQTINRSLPLKTIVRMGGIICGSSDSPVQSLNPFLQIHGMVNYPIEKERLSVYEAFRSYTYNGAWATFEEESRGTLKKGKLADFIIMLQNPFEIPPESLLGLKVQSTWIGGRKTRPVKLSPASLPFLLFRKKKKL